MDTLFLFVEIFLVLLMAATLYRGIIGPTVLDRLLAANGVGAKTVVLLIYIGISFHSLEMFVDIALAYAMLNFIAVLAAGRFFQKRKGLHTEYREQDQI